ncbi:MAG: polysaccharide biosynthesis/export family protein [Thiotrichales bacterium]
MSNIITGIGMLLVLGIMLGGCASSPSEPVDTGSSEADQLRASVQRSAYEIQPGDKLFISVYNEEDLQKEVVVRPDGGLTFPLVGDIDAGGLSVAQLQQRIAAGLSQYISEPVVSVTVQEVVGNKVFVLGQVKSPGEYVLTGGTNVLQALSMAGGLTAFANTNKIKVIRKDPVTGAEEIIPFDYRKIIRGRGLDKNIRLRSGDTIIVP